MRGSSGWTASADTTDRNAAASAYGLRAATVAADFLEMPGSHFSAAGLSRFISIGTGSAVTDRCP